MPLERAELEQQEVEHDPMANKEARKADLHAVPRNCAESGAGDGANVASTLPQLQNFEVESDSDIECIGTVPASGFVSTSIPPAWWTCEACTFDNREKPLKKGQPAKCEVCGTIKARRVVEGNLGRAHTTSCVVSHDGAPCGLW